MMVLALSTHLFALVEQWVFSCDCVCYALDGKLSFFTLFFFCTHFSHLFIFWHTLFYSCAFKIFTMKTRKQEKLKYMSSHIIHIEVILWASNSVPNSFYLEFWSKTQCSTSLISFVSNFFWFLNVIDQIRGFNFTRITLYFNPKVWHVFLLV